MAFTKVLTYLKCELRATPHRRAMTGTRRTIMTGFCGQCGKPVSEDFMFCGNCGARIESTPVCEHPSPSYSEHSSPPLHEQSSPHHPEQPSPPYSEQPSPPHPAQPSPHHPEQSSQHHPEQSPASDQEPQFPSTPITVDFEPIADCVIEPVKPAPPPPPSPAAAIARTFLSVILSILCFAFILLLVALVSLRPGNIPDIVAGADVTWVFDETDIGEVVVEGLNQSDFIEKRIDLDTIKEFINRENVAAEFGLIAEKYAQAIADGEFDFYLNSSEIVNSIKAIAPEIYEEFGASFTDDDLDLIASSIDEFIDLKEFSVAQVMEQSSVDVAVPHAIFSAYPLIIVSLLCALVIADIVLLQRKKAENALLAAGIPVSASGLVFLAFGLFIGPLTGLIADNPVYGAFRLAAGMTATMLILGFGFLALGIAAVILFSVATKARSRRQPKTPNARGGNTWIVIGLATNLSTLAACAIISLLFYLNL